MTGPRTLLGVAAALLGLAGPAAAAPPPNDDYLNSTPVLEPFGPSHLQVRDQIDTTEATVQPELFGPARSGGGPETSSCKGAPYGRTVWYDLAPRERGTAEIQTAGYDAALALYEFDPHSAQITASLGCVNEPGTTEDVYVPLRKGRHYTLQVGGVGAAGGPLQATFDFFPDRDGDGVFDALDTCPRRPGVEAVAGCLPILSARVSYGFDRTSGGVRLTDLRAAGAPVGALVSLRCTRGCSLRGRLTVRRPGQVVVVKRAIGASLGTGARFELRVTRGATGASDRYRYGAIGKVWRFEVAGRKLRRSDLCLLPGSTTPRRHCR